MNRQSEVEKIADFIHDKYVINEAFDCTDCGICAGGCLEIAKHLVDSGIRSKDGFEIKDLLGEQEPEDYFTIEPIDFKEKHET